MDSTYFPILIQLLLAVGIALSILLLSHLFGARAHPNAIQDSPYECGVLSTGDPHPQFSIKFYVTAMLFILFDIEVVFLIPGIVVYRDFIANNMSIVGPLFFFIGLLVIGFLYELKKGALQWEK